jgi:hypothetical protein
VDQRNFEKAMTEFLNVCPIGVLEELYPGYLFPDDHVLPDMEDKDLHGYLVKEVISSMMDNNGDSGGETGERDMADAIRFLLLALDHVTPTGWKVQSTPMSLLQNTLDTIKMEGG